MSAVPVASTVEDGHFYVVMVETMPGQVPGRDPAIKRTTLTVHRLSTALGIAILDAGDQVRTMDLFTPYAALKPTGGLFWEYCGRRLLDEYLAGKRRVLTQQQILGYEERYRVCGEVMEVSNG